MVSPRFMTQPNDAAKELLYFVVNNPEALPEDLKLKVLEHLEPGRSVAFAVSEAAEMIYARKKELPKEVLLLGAELAICASHNRINNFADEDGQRGRDIAEALRKASGEKTPPGMSWIAAADEPHPKPVYVAGPDNDPNASVPAPEPTQRLPR